MGVKITNNASGTLAAAITSGATTLTLTSGQGALFPTLGVGDYCWCTLVDTSNNVEIIKVTARSTDTLTMTRGQDNTTAQAFAISDRLELRPTAALFAEFADNLPLAGGTMTGTIVDFESTGIDDNATSTAITIDASENVLIGMTAVSGTTDGLHLRSGIASGVNVTNDHCFALNRKSSDGEALRFLKDGALVGSIDVSASGASIKLGGTAAANALDDYEEGTWTPAITGPSGSAVPGMAYTTQVGSYTKVGNIVSVRIALNFTANSGNPLRRVSLPFTGTGQTGILAGAGISPSNLNFGNGTQACAYAAPGNAYLALTISGDELAQQYPSATSQSMSIRVSMTYEV